MDNDEMHELTVEALKKAASQLTADQLSLLCWHCGIQVDLIKESQNAMV